MSNSSPWVGIGNLMFHQKNKDVSYSPVVPFTNNTPAEIHEAILGGFSYDEPINSPNVCKTEKVSAAAQGLGKVTICTVNPDGSIVQGLENIPAISFSTVPHYSYEIIEDGMKLSRPYDHNAELVEYKFHTGGFVSKDTVIGYDPAHRCNYSTFCFGHKDGNGVKIENVVHCDPEMISAAHKRILLGAKFPADYWRRYVNCLKKMFPGINLQRMFSHKSNNWLKMHGIRMRRRVL
jgi:hypothetical protein